MNPLHSIFRNTAVHAFAHVVQRASTIVLSLMIARRLGASGLGIYSAAVVLYGVISIAAEMGSSNFLVREIAKDRQVAGRYLVHVSAMAVLAGCVFTLGAWLVLPHLGYSHELARSMYIITFAIVPGTLQAIQEAVFVADQRVQLIAYSSLVSGFALVGCTLVLLLRGADVVALVGAFAGVQCLVTVFYFGFMGRYLRGVSWRLDRAFAWRLLRDMRAFTGCSLLAAMFARPEILILSFFGNEAAMGFYSAAARMIDVWSFIPQTFMTNVFPVLSRAHRDGDGSAQYVQEKSLKYLLAFTMPVTIGMAVLARPIVRLLYGPHFEMTAQLVPILAWTLPLVAVSAVLWRVLAARGFQGLVFRVQVVTTLVRLGPGCALVALYSAFGAAVVPPLVHLLNLVLLARYVRQHGMAVSVFQPGWRFAVAAAAMGALVYPMRNLVAFAWVFGTAVVLYGLSVILLRAFAPDDVSLLRGLLLRKQAAADY